MVVQEIDVITKETMDKNIAEAAKAAAYETGFGVAGCDRRQ